ncbi:two-component system response regulator, partial [Escherichia coli]|nr:two-component system response regulator [Escherichia coli]
LTDYFLKKHTRGTDREIKLSPEAKKIIENYHYPGNVRQLESAIERAILLCENDVITPDDLPPEMTAGDRSAAAAAGNEQFIL